MVLWSNDDLLQNSPARAWALCSPSAEASWKPPPQLFAKPGCRYWSVASVKKTIKKSDHLAWRSLWCCVSCSLNTSIHELLPLLHKVLKTIWKTVLMRGERSTCESQKVNVSVPYLWWGGRYGCSAKDREGTTILSSRLQILKTRYMLRKQRKKSRTTSRPAIFSVLRSSTGAALRTGLGLREACDYSVPSLASSN